MNLNGKNLIYAVDDEESIRDLYRYALEDAGFEVSCFDGSENFFRAVGEKMPDLVLLDVMLDGMDGYEILSALRKMQGAESLPVIMISAKGSEIDKVKGLNLGADDYLSKPFGILELIARIRANLRKQGTKQEEKNQYKDIIIDETRHSISVKGKVIQTTAKEYELLKLFVRNSGAALDRNFILDRVWGENYGETRTLDLHIMQVRRLIEDSSAEIKTIRTVGYMLE